MRPRGVLLANGPLGETPLLRACPAPTAMPILRRKGAGPRLLQGVARRIPVPCDVGFRAAATPYAGGLSTQALAHASQGLSRRLREEGTAYAAGIVVLEEHGIVSAYSYRDANAGSSIALRGALASLSHETGDEPHQSERSRSAPADAASRPSHAALERAWLHAGVMPGPPLRAQAPAPTGIFEAWLSPSVASADR